MTEDAIFRYSSLTKPIVTAAALSLVDDGIFRLDDEVRRWIPEFRAKTADGEEPAISVRQLLTHTAGFSYGFLEPADGPYAAAGVSDGMDASGLSMEEELNRLASVPLSYKSGAAWGYSVSLDVLGEVMARVTGLTLPEIVRQGITGVLRMEDTGFAVVDRNRLVTPYVDGRPPQRMADRDLVGTVSGVRCLMSPSRIFDSRSFVSGGTGMAGTAGDFLTFLESVRQGGGAILKPDTAQAMMSNQIAPLRITTEPTPAWGFGFGGAVLLDPEMAQSPQPAGTWKWGGVYGHNWFVDPVNRLSVVTLTNTALEGMSGSFVADFIRGIYTL